MSQSVIKKQLNVIVEDKSLSQIAIDTQSLAGTWRTSSFEAVGKSGYKVIALAIAEMWSGMANPPIPYLNGKSAGNETVGFMCSVQETIVSLCLRVTYAKI